MANEYEKLFMTNFLSSWHIYVFIYTYKNIYIRCVMLLKKRSNEIQTKFGNESSSCLSISMRDKFEAHKPFMHVHGRKVYL